MSRSESVAATVAVALSGRDFSKLDLAALALCVGGMPVL